MVPLIRICKEILKYTSDLYASLSLSYFTSSVKIYDIFTAEYNINNNELAIISYINSSQSLNLNLNENTTTLPWLTITDTSQILYLTCSYSNDDAYATEWELLEADTMVISINGEYFDPTEAPTPMPSQFPSFIPTNQPSITPTAVPTRVPTNLDDYIEKGTIIYQINKLTVGYHSTSNNDSNVNNNEVELWNKVDSVEVLTK